MGVEFSDIQKVVRDDGQQWWSVLGQMIDGSLLEHQFPTRALKWRAAEYGIDPTDIDTLFQILFSEMVTLTLPNVQQLNKEHPWPYNFSPEEAWAKKQAHMAKISELQGQALRSAKVSVQVDRSELSRKLKGMLPDLRDHDLEELILRRALIDPKVKREAERLLSSPTNGIKSAKQAIKGADIVLSKGIPFQDITPEVIDHGGPIQA